jgi:hypothetical protein
VASIADRSPKRAATRRVVIYAALAIAILSLVGLLASNLAGAHGAAVLCHALREDAALRTCEQVAADSSPEVAAASERAAVTALWMDVREDYDRLNEMFDGQKR